LIQAIVLTDLFSVPYLENSFQVVLKKKLENSFMVAHIAVSQFANL